ncbi:flagellar hook-length control protein FliK [Brenneria sp. 4F2]|nr:flagellar hook-length control protein FliK [Brenneria bubanii]
MLNQAQTLKTEATSNVAASVPDSTLAPAQSVAASLTLTDEAAATDVAAESDTALTPFTLADADSNSRQINRADMETSKKPDIAINIDDSVETNASADKSTITAAVVKSAESLTANTPSHTSPLMASASQALSATAQTATPAATSATTTSGAMLNAQMGSEAWQQTLGQQVVMFARDGQQSAKLRLHPEELGALQINLTLNNDNEAQLHFVSAHSQVRAALEAALPHLRTSLAESGIDLGQASVGSESSQSWTQDQHASDSGFVNQSEQVTSDGLATPLSVPASLQQMASGVTGINIFA